MFSFVSTSDTLILDGQVIYLDQDTVSQNDRCQFDFDADYRKIRKKGIWGVEVNAGLLSVSNQPNEGIVGQKTLFELSPQFSKRSWGGGFGVMGYYHLQDHLALRAGVEYSQISWKSIQVNNINEWNDKDIFESSFNTTGLQAFYKVLVDTAWGLYELDTLTIQPEFTRHQIQITSYPVMAAFHLSATSKRYKSPNVLMLEMGGVYRKIRIESPSFVSIDEMHHLSMISEKQERSSSWNMRSAITLKRLVSKKKLNAVFLVSRFQLDWPPRIFNQEGWSWKLPGSYLTFGILWERGKSLHSLNN